MTTERQVQLQGQALKLMRENSRDNILNNCVYIQKCQKCEQKKSHYQKAIIFIAQWIE
jgi:hypothetical protein